MSLYQHRKHPHTPQNINVIHAEQQQGLNARIAVYLTAHVGSMWCAYTFVVLAVIGLLGILNLLPPLVALLVAWASQTLIQLALLPIIMVGQQVLNQKQELQATEQFNTTQRSYHDLEQMSTHLEKQDEELLKHSAMLLKQNEMLLDLLKHNEAPKTSKRSSKSVASVELDGKRIGEQ